MDPVTITATVVTFATAVKDLVELGQKIHESFAKVSKNRRSAQRAADNIKDMIGDIDTIYKNHQEALTNMEEFDLALKDLLEKFRGFEASILPLVPQSRGSWISMAFLRGWWNNNKIKESILDLEADVREVKQRYMMKSAMRMEVKQEVNHQDATRRLEGISEGLEIVRTDVHAIRVSTSATTIAPIALGTSDERERNIMMFVRSAMSKSTSLLRPPDEVTEDVWTTVFIKSQIHYIEAEVEKMSTLCIFAQTNAPPFSVSVFTGYSTEISCLRRDVVRKLMDLRDVLPASGGLQAISVGRAATQLNNTSLRLSALGFHEESKLFLDWTIKLARALVNAPGLRGEAQHRASLAFYLLRLSWVCGDMTQSREAVEESLSIAETLLSQNCTDMEIQGLCADILLQYAQYAPDNESAITRSMRAIQLLEGIFQVKTLARMDSHGITGAVMNPSYDLVNHVFSLSPRPIMIVRCADAFQDLAVYTLRAVRPDNAKRLAHLCIALRRRMVSVYGDDKQQWLANTLSFICRGELARCFTDIELLDMVDECALLFRQLTENNPVYYSQHLLRILWRKADILERLNRDSDSISILQEAARLAGQIIQDFGLRHDALFRLAQNLCKAHRYLDAVSAMARIPAMFHSELHGSLYRDLSHDLLETRRYKESAEAANNSIAIYRKLRPDGPAQEMEWTHNLMSALSTLGLSQFALGNHTGGMSSLNECVGIASNTLNAALDALPDSLEESLGAFQTHVTHVICSSFYGNKLTINLNSTAIQTLERLVARHPQNKDVFETLADTQIYFAYLLYRLGRLQDAREYADQSFDAWTSRGDSALDDQWYAARMKQIKAQTLGSQGYTLEARLVIHTLRLAVGDNYSTLLARVYWVQLSVDLGELEKGLEVAEEVLEQSRSKLGNFQWQLALPLFGVAYAALHSQNYQRTMEAAGEGIELSADPEWVANEDEEDICIRPSLFAIMSSAKANTGNLDRAMDYVQQAVTLSLDIAGRATTAKHSLMETRGYLAEVLLATGKVTQAREICHERKVYFTQRVENKGGDPRLGEYRDLAPILRMLGVLCCSEGRHEEGEAAAQQLTEIIRRLGLTFPSLLEQVKIRLRYQASVPILKVLDEMTEKLECEHQKGIKALFEV